MITIVEGHFLIRYWKRNTREGLEENVLKDKFNRVCRFEFHCSGLEIFLFNRSSIYDWIREEYGLEKKSKENISINESIGTHLISTHIQVQVYFKFYMTRVHQTKL